MSKKDLIEKKNDLSRQIIVARGNLKLAEEELNSCTASERSSAYHKVYEKWLDAVEYLDKLRNQKQIIHKRLYGTQYVNM